MNKIFLQSFIKQLEKQGIDTKQLAARVYSSPIIPGVWGTAMGFLGGSKVVDMLAKKFPKLPTKRLKILAALSMGTGGYLTRAFEVPIFMKAFKSKTRSKPVWF